MIGQKFLGCSGQGISTIVQGTCKALSGLMWIVSIACVYERRIQGEMSRENLISITRERNTIIYLMRRDDVCLLNVESKS